MCGDNCETCFCGFCKALLIIILFPLILVICIVGIVIFIVLLPLYLCAKVRRCVLVALRDCRRRRGWFRIEFSTALFFSRSCQLPASPLRRRRSGRRPFTVGCGVASWMSLSRVDAVAPPPSLLREGDSITASFWF